MRKKISYYSEKIKNHENIPVSQVNNIDELINILKNNYKLDVCISECGKFIECNCVYCNLPF